MSVRVVLHPAANNDAQRHYRDTVLAPVPIERIAPHVSPEQIERLQEIYTSAAPIWGVASGPKNDVQWGILKPGDIVLFVAERSVFCSAVVTMKIESEALARAVWTDTEEGTTWSHIYFLTDVRPRVVPRERWLPAIEAARNTTYEKPLTVWGFSVESETSSAYLIESLELDNEAFPEDVEEDQYKRIVRGFDPTKPTDAVTNALRRTEQSFLRKHLFGRRPTGTCAICGEILPVAFLHAAHVKPRSKCDVDERLDYPHIVMPACTLGCDALYERRYIVVRNGRIARGPTGLATPALSRQIDALVGRHCPHWTQGSAGYFAWHADFPNQPSVQS